MRNSPKEVFRGGWEELANAIHTPNISSVLPNVIDFKMRPDGSQIIVLEPTQLGVYDLAIPYDISSHGAINSTINFVNALGFDVKNDGSVIYFVNAISTSQFNLNTPWDPSSINFPSFESIVINIPNISAITFSRDGDFFFVVDTVSGITRFPLPIPFDITSNVSNALLYNFANKSDVKFKPEGDKMFVVDFDTHHIEEFVLNTLWDPSDRTFVSNIEIDETTTPTSLDVRSNGKEYFVLDTSGPNIRKYNGDQSWVGDTVSYFSNTEPGPGGFTSIRAINWKPDGTKYYLADRTGNVSNIIEFTTLHPHNQTGAVQTGIFNLTTENRITGMWWRPDGTRLYTIGLSDRIRQIDVSIPWEVSLASMSISPNIGNPGGLGLPNGIFFKFENGQETRMYISGASSPDFVKQFDLTTPGDITGLILVGTLDVELTASNPQDLVMKLDGKQLYLISLGMDIVARFVLSIPWDVTSTLLPVDSVNIAPLEINGTGMFIRQHDGKKLYIVGTTNLSVISYDMSINLVP